MSTWRILEWSKELGRGAISSAHSGRIEFDAARADVADFSLGEIVHVELEPGGGAPRVRRIWPDLPRFRERPDARPAAALDERLRAESEAAIAAAKGWSAMRVALAPGVVRLELDDDSFMYGPSAWLDLVDPTYIELTTVLDVRVVQLADASARSYLATRIELSSADIAVAIIDEDANVFFVVARRVSFADGSTRLR